MSIYEHDNWLAAVDYLDGRAAQVVSLTHREAVGIALEAHDGLDDDRTIICRDMPVEHTGAEDCPCRPLILDGVHGLTLDEVMERLEGCGG